MKKIGFSFLFILFSGLIYFYISNQPSVDSKAAVTPYKWTTEEKDFHDLYFSSGHYQGFNRSKNYYEKFFQATGTIDSPLILVTGLEDITENWRDTVKAAFKRGFKTVYVYELRGQGRSERKNNIQAIDIENFSEYIFDVVQFFKHIKEQDGIPTSSPFMITHSTGSLVIAAAMDEISKQTPSLKPAKIVHLAPLFKLNVPPILKQAPVFAMVAGFSHLARSMGWIILGKKFVDRPFEQNKVTNNKELYEKSVKIRTTENLRSSGVSLSWATATQAEISIQASHGFKELDQPNLILLADDERVVDNDWNFENPNFKVESVKNSKHAMHMETTAVFLGVMDRSFRFFLAPMAQEKE